MKRKISTILQSTSAKFIGHEHTFLWTSFENYSSVVWYLTGFVLLASVASWLKKKTKKNPQSMCITFNTIKQLTPVHFKSPLLCTVINKIIIWHPACCNIFLFLYYICFKTISISCTTEFLSKTIFSITCATTHMIQVKDLHSVSSITSELNYVERIFHLFTKMSHFNHRSMKKKNFSLEIKYLWKVCLHSDWYIMGKIKKRVILITIYFPALW